MKPTYATAFAAVGLLLLSGSSPALADMQTFNSATPASNAATRDAWLAASGIAAPEYRVDFESGFANGQNVSGIGGLFPAGLVITDTGPGTPEAVVGSGAGIVGGSNPVGAFALTHDGDPYLVLDFATGPVDYLAFQDIDQAGSVGTVTFADGSTAAISFETTSVSGDSAEFFAIFRNDRPRIVKVEINASGAIPWGIDNIEYGIVAAGPYLADLSLKSSIVAGCKNVTGTVTLSEPAPLAGAAVMIADTLESATCPATVIIPAGATSARFTIKTVPVLAQQNGKVNATLGDVTRTTDLSVRPIGLSSLSLSPTSVVGGKSSKGTAKLECNAAPGPITVDLGSSNPAVAEPVAKQIVVPQAMQSQTFDVETNVVLAKSVATISGTANGITSTKKLTVNPAVSVSPTSLKFGEVAIGTVSEGLLATLTNQGFTSVSVTGIILTGSSAPYFDQIHSCLEDLQTGESCEIRVTFSPTVAGKKSAKLSIETTATSTPLSVSVSGTGVALP